MDNILYIGPYREFSGMGNASRAYIKALAQTGHNISIRPIYNIHKNYPETSLDPEILELESNFSKQYHKVIQHCYPHQLCYDSRFDHHIGIIHLESSNYKNNILQNLLLMDTIVVGSSITKDQLQNRISTKIQVIPEPIDLSVIETYKNQHLNKKDHKQFNFYCLGEWINRKNFNQIILCFIRLCSYYDNINLIIKTKSNSMDDNLLKNQIEYNLGQNYDILKNNNKKPKILIGDIDINGIYYIHNNNDCFLNISKGESFGYSTLEAMAFGNNIIVNDKIGSSSIVSGGCGMIVETEQEKCMDPDRIYHIYNTIDQYWQNSISDSLYGCMELAINENDEQRYARQNRQKEKIKNYDITNIAELFNRL